MNNPLEKLHSGEEARGEAKEMKRRDLSVIIVAVLVIHGNLVSKSKDILSGGTP